MYSGFRCLFGVIAPVPLELSSSLNGTTKEAGSSFAFFVLKRVVGSFAAGPLHAGSVWACSEVRACSEVWTGPWKGNWAALAVTRFPLSLVFLLIKVSEIGYFVTSTSQLRILRKPENVFVPLASANMNSNIFGT